VGMAVVQTEIEIERESRESRVFSPKNLHLRRKMEKEKKLHLSMLYHDVPYFIVIFTFLLNDPNETSSWFLSVRRSLGQQRTRREEDRFHPRPSRVGWSRMFEVVLRRIVRQRFFVRTR